MEHSKDDDRWQFHAKRRFRIIIVGAGISGLVAAIGLKRSRHDVVVLEQAPKLGETGAGLQVPPNASRIFRRFGLLEQVMGLATELESNCQRRWKDNKVLGTGPLMPQVGEKYNAPLTVIHRPDLQSILLDALSAAGVEVSLNQKVTKIDPNFSARVQVNSRKWIEGDLVIAADGIKSIVRKQMVAGQGAVDRTIPTGDAAYRLMIPRDRLKEDPDLLKMLDSNVCMRWMGPNAHVVSYPIKNNQAYNMVLVHPQRPGSENQESWTNRGDKQEMLDFFKDWNETLLRFLAYVPEGEVIEWTLNSHAPLPTWIQNRCALTGDACHPMLPYVAQGAAQAIEDAGVLTVLLSMADDIPTALRGYDRLRKERAEKIQVSATQTRTTLHLPDGPEQEIRDLKISGKGPSPDLWADREWQDFMWGADVMKDASEGWETLTAEIQ